MKMRGVLGGCALAVGLVFAVPARAQNVGASIQGTVTDASGQALPGAHVTVRNVGTGDARELIADMTGRFHAPLLSPGE